MWVIYDPEERNFYSSMGWTDEESARGYMTREAAELDAKACDNEGLSLMVVLRKDRRWEWLDVRVSEEYARATTLFPGSSTNLLALCEEHGELVKASLDYAQGKSSIADVRKELVQTMAMCLRLWFQGDASIKLDPVRWGTRHG